MAKKTLKVGDEIFVHNLDNLKPLTKCKILCFTEEPGKLIGVVFDKVLPHAHSCDNRGKNGLCMWAHPDHVLTGDAVAALKLELDKQAAEKKVRAEREASLVLELDTDEDGNTTKRLVPAGKAPEKQTVATKDVLALKVK